MAKSRLDWLLVGSLITFSIGATVGSQFNPIFLWLGYIAAATMGVVSLLLWARGYQPLVPEVMLLWVFCIWAVVSGLVLANDLGAFWYGVERLLQISIIAFSVAGFSARLRTLAPGMVAAFMTSLVLSVYSVNLGENVGALELMERGFRTHSMVHNPNLLGLTALWGFIAVTFLAPRARGFWVRYLLWGVVPLLMLVMIASASRKALVLPAVYVGAWVWLCYKGRLFRRWQGYAAILLSIAVLGWGVPWVVENTFAGYRLRRAINTETPDNSTKVRLLLYREGFEILGRAPVAGIGIRQWPLYGTTAYSHSDYIEVFATTGFVGGFLYVLPYLMVARRLMRLRQLGVAEETRYEAGVALAYLITVAVCAFAQVLFYNLVYWVLMGSLWGYAFGAERRLREVRLQQRRSVASVLGL